MIVLPLSVLVCLTGCKDDDAVSVTPEPEEPVKTAEELLADIPGVTILQTTKDSIGEDITVFYFEQPIDHTDPSARHLPTVLCAALQRFRPRDGAAYAGLFDLRSEKV